MFIVHVHCSLFMFIVHCSHGATLIFDDVFYLAYTPLPSGKRCQVVVLPVSQRCLVPTFRCQAVEKLLVNGGEVKTVKQLAQGLPVHHVVVLDVLQQTLLQGRALAEHAVD